MHLALKYSRNAVMAGKRDKKAVNNQMTAMAASPTSEDGVHFAILETTERGRTQLLGRLMIGQGGCESCDKRYDASLHELSATE